MYRTIIFCHLLILFLGCEQSPDNPPGTVQGDVYHFADEAASETRVVANRVCLCRSGSLPSTRNRRIREKIFRNGNLTIESNDLRRSGTRLDILVVSCSGYISSESFNDQEDQLSYNITCSLPAENFDQFISGVEPGPVKGSINFLYMDHVRTFLLLDNIEPQYTFGAGHYSFFRRNGVPAKDFPCF